MSVSSFKKSSSRPSSARSSSNTFRSEDFSSEASSSLSASSDDLSTIKSKELNKLNKHDDDKSSVKNASTLFIKPPAPPPRKQPLHAKSENYAVGDGEQKNLKINIDDLNSSLSESNAFFTPKTVIETSRSQLVPAEKISKCEQLIKTLWNEYNAELTDDSADKNDLIESLLNEHIGLNTLNLIAYGETNLNYVRSSVNLAKFYLEYKNYAKQAKMHCENTITIFDKIQLNNENNVLYNETGMILYYVIGRACTLLKKNKEGAEYLEISRRYFDEYEKLLKINLSKDLIDWKKKLNIALAKQYAINENYSTSLVFYNNAIEVIRENQSNNSAELIGLYEDKAKIKQNQEQYDEAVNMLQKAIEIAEVNTAIVRVIDCKLQLAKVHVAQYGDIKHSTTAEKLLNECINGYNGALGETHEKSLSANEELIKFLIKQNDRYEELKDLLKKQIENQITAYGDFNENLETSYKLLSSVYLKLNDMPKAALYLKKCLDIEELNYGAQSKAYIETKESFDNLKKNPSVMKKLKITNPSEKPKFSAATKVDNRKHDLKIYQDSKSNEQNISNSTLNNSIVKKTDLSMSELSKKISPVK